MSTLVIAEHDNQENKAQTLVAIAAAEAIGNEIHVLVAGSGAPSGLPPGSSKSVPVVLSEACCCQ